MRWCRYRPATGDLAGGAFNQSPGTRQQSEYPRFACISHGGNVVINATLPARVNPRTDEDSDGFERTLLEARSLIDSTVIAYRSIAAQHVAAEAESDRESKDSPVLQLIGEARQRVS